VMFLYHMELEFLLKRLVCGDTKHIRRRGRDPRNRLDAGDAVRSSVLSLISAAPATPVTINC